MNATTDALNLLRDIDSRLRECIALGLTAAEAYDSAYQESVAEALHDDAPKDTAPGSTRGDDTALLDWLENRGNSVMWDSGWCAYTSRGHLIGRYATLREAIRNAMKGTT
jgi:hypothetical protein